MSFLDWRVGMKVGLKHGAPVGAFDGFAYPQPNQIYPIRSIFVSLAGDVCLRLLEITNPEADYPNGRYEPGFRASWFRRVQTRQTDISIFTAMLHDQHDKVPA